jgi:hypothetical protein
MEKICRNKNCGLKAEGEAIKDFFHKDNSKLLGYANICKNCKNKLTASYRQKAKEKL